MASVHFQDVTKRFGEIVAVRAMTLDVRDGEFLVLLGPSGCGKSTALRMVAGLETPDEGTISLDEVVVNHIEAKQRDVAMVFQTYALYPHMSVRDNIAFPLKPRGIGRAERHERASRAAAQLGLDDLLDRKPAQLSGGQRQRVALARAIVREPAAYLMDEPLSNLDAKLRAETRAELVELHARLGTTFLYVTHDQVEAMTMADRIAILLDGELQQVGTPDDIYAMPANLFVAGFIGTPPMNTWVARRANGSLTVAGAPVSVGSASSFGDEVVFGVRPEDVAFEADGIPATVDAVESLGHERLVSCTLQSGELAVVRVTSHQAAPKVGEPVHLVARSTEVRLFEPETGELVA